MERTLVPASGVRCFFFPMRPPSSIRGLLSLVLAAIRSAAVIVRTHPRVTLATGGYVSAPAAFAAWLLRVPVVLFLPDVVPGRAVAWLAPRARKIAVSAEDSLRWLPSDKAVVTGYPVRAVFERASREGGRRRLDLPLEASVICVVGGSLGAQSVNAALSFWLPRLLANHYVVHVCGERNVEAAREAAAGLDGNQRSRYRLFPFLEAEDMAAALAAADLAVCRSGASVLGELPATGTPAVLVPLPIPAVHQLENARYLAGRGAAVILENDDLPEALGPTLEVLLADPSRLHAMATACRSLARPDAARAIAEIVEREAS